MAGAAAAGTKAWGLRPLLKGPGAAFAVGSVLLLGALAPLAQAAGAPLVLRPGLRSGEVKQHALRRGEGYYSLIVRYGVNPVRISGAHSGGRRVWGSYTVDTRRVTPSFHPGVDGVVLNVPEAQVYLVRGGHLVKDYPVAVSHPSTPTWVGTTRVVNKMRHPTWYVPMSIQREMEEKGLTVIKSMPPGPSNPLGPRWIGIWNGSFGLHGTNNPASIKQYASHGCVRFRANDIRDLFERVSVGTPVRIVYQPVTLAADRHGVWITAYPDIYGRGFDYQAAVRELATGAGALERVDWALVSAALRRRNGILANVAKAGMRVPEPVAVPLRPTLPTPAARPSATQRPPVALPSPVGSPPFGGWPELSPEPTSPEGVPPDLPELPGSAP